MGSLGWSEFFICPYLVALYHTLLVYRREIEGLFSLDLKRIYILSTFNINSELQILQVKLCSDSYATLITQNTIWPAVCIIFLKTAV